VKVLKDVSLKCNLFRPAVSIHSGIGGRGGGANGLSCADAQRVAGSPMVSLWYGFNSTKRVLSMPFLKMEKKKHIDHQELNYTFSCSTP
jgi:hypothetical protein